MKHSIHALGGGKTEFEERTLFGLRRRKILRLALDPTKDETIMAALVEGVIVNGIPLPSGNAMIVNLGDKIILPSGKAYLMVKPVK